MATTTLSLRKEQAQHDKQKSTNNDAINNEPKSHPSTSNPSVDSAEVALFPPPTPQDDPPLESNKPNTRAHQEHLRQIALAKEKQARAESEAKSLRSKYKKLENKYLSLEKEKDSWAGVHEDLNDLDEDEAMFGFPFCAIAKSMNDNLLRSTAILEAVGNATKANAEIFLKFSERGSAAREIGSGSTSSATMGKEGSSSSSTDGANAKSSSSSSSSSSETTATTSSTYRIPRTEPARHETEKDLAYKQEIFEALKELRILAEADLIRLTQHRDHAKKCVELGLCPPSLRIKSYNWPIQLPSPLVKREVDAVIQRAEHEKMRIFYEHYEQAAAERTRLIVRITKHISTLTSKSPHLGEKCGDIDRRESIALSELKQRRAGGTKRMRENIEKLAKAKNELEKKLHVNDQDRQFHMSLLGPLFDANPNDDVDNDANDAAAKQPSAAKEGSSSSSSSSSSTTTTAPKKRKGKELANAGPSTSSSASASASGPSTAAKKNDGTLLDGDIEDDPLRFLQRTVEYRPDWEVDDAWAMACAWATITNTAAAQPSPQQQRGKQLTIVESIEARRNLAIKRKRVELGGDFDVDPSTSNVHGDDVDDDNVDDEWGTDEQFPPKSMPTSTKPKRSKANGKGNRKYQSKKGTTALTTTPTTSTTTPSSKQSKGTTTTKAPLLMSIDLPSSSGKPNDRNAPLNVDAKNADTAGSPAYYARNDRGGVRGRGYRGRNWWKSRREGHAQNASIQPNSSGYRGRGDGNAFRRGRGRS